MATISFKSKLRELKYAATPFELIVADPTGAGGTDIQDGLDAYLNTNYPSAAGWVTNVVDTSDWEVVYDTVGKDWWPIIMWLMGQFVKQNEQIVVLITITEP